MASAPSRQIDSLQVARGLAAVAVLFHHAAQSTDHVGDGLLSILSVPCSYGYLGVDFFFVLSGFIIYYVNCGRVGKPSWPRKYAESRVTRVYLPYLPIGIVVGVAYVALPQLSSGANHWDWFSTITLLPSSKGPALSPAWTLRHEVAFYAVAFIFLYIRKVWVGCLLGGAVALTYDAAVGGTYKAFGAIDLEFIFGIAAAWCFINRRVCWDRVLVIAGLLLCAVFFLIDDRNLTVIFGLGIALILLPIVRLEASGHIHATKPLLLLGNASYAIYLVHHPMVSVLARIMRDIPPELAFTLIVVICLGAGIAYHKFAEVRLIGIGRRALEVGHGHNQNADNPSMLKAEDSGR